MEIEDKKMNNDEMMGTANANTTGNDEGDAMTKDMKKKNSGMLIGLIVLAIVALGGIGFGVWAMVDGNNQTRTLNNQISDLKKTNSELTEKLSRQEEKPVVDNEVIIDADTATKVNSEDYIYVGEWGLKIKIPENLDKVSYMFEQYGDVAGGGAGLVVSGVRGYDGHLPGFADLNENASGLGHVHRVLDGQECGSGNTKVFSSDGYNYCYSHPQALFSIGDELIGLEAESTALVTSMLNNAENYSAI